MIIMGNSCMLKVEICHSDRTATRNICSTARNICSTARNLSRTCHSDKRVTGANVPTSETDGVIRSFTAAKLRVYFWGKS